MVSPDVSLTALTYSSARCRGQEEGKDALFRKRKVLQLVSHWSRLYKDFPKEEEHVRSFMKVRQTALRFLYSCLFLIWSFILQCPLICVTEDYKKSHSSSYVLSSLTFLVRGRPAFGRGSCRDLLMFQFSPQRTSLFSIFLLTKQDSKEDKNKGSVSYHHRWLPVLLSAQDNQWNYSHQLYPITSNR